MNKNAKANENENVIYIGGNIVGIFRWWTTSNGRVVEGRCLRWKWRNPSSCLIKNIDGKVRYKQNLLLHLFWKISRKGAIARRYPKYTIRVLVSREDALLNKQKEAFHKLFKGSLLNMCKTFLQNEEVTKEEIEEMKKLIDSFDEEDQEEDKDGNKSS